MSVDWLVSSWRDLAVVVASALILLSATIVVVRLCGLRSLSKMSSFDFAVTVAIGSVVGSVTASSTPALDGVVAIASLLGIQVVIALMRQRSQWGSGVDNEPVLLMVDGEYCEEALLSSRVTRRDVVAKLREANVTDMSQVLAVVLETTGDVSVLHGSGPLADDLLLGVVGAGPDG